MMKRQSVMGLLLALMLAVASMGVVSAQEATSTAITLGDVIVVDGDGATVSGSAVTISAAGSYTLSGTLADGQIVVDTQDSGLVTLILDGAEITSSSGSAISVVNAEAVTVVLAEGSVNSVTDATAHSDDDENETAAIWSVPALSVEGEGSLTISGTYIGIYASELLTIDGGAITVNTEDDALKSDGDFVMNDGSVTLAAQEKGVNALYTLTINDGEINVLTSEEGLEGGYIIVNGGEISVVATDEGINVSEPNDTGTGYYLQINGGTIVVDAEGDGLDANGSIEMTGGVVIVNGPTQPGNGALDYDATFDISGGVLVAVGSASMPTMPSDSSSQYSVMINFDTALSAGTLVHIETSDGADVLTFAAAKSFQSLVFSTPELTNGETYTIYTGGSSDGAETSGLYEGGSVSGDTLYNSLTISSINTTLGQVRRGR